GGAVLEPSRENLYPVRSLASGDPETTDVSAQESSDRLGIRREELLPREHHVGGPFGPDLVRLGAEAHESRRQRLELRGALEDRGIDSSRAEGLPADHGAAGRNEVDLLLQSVPPEDVTREEVRERARRGDRDGPPAQAFPRAHSGRGEPLEVGLVEATVEGADAGLRAGGRHQGVQRREGDVDRAGYERRRGLGSASE